MKAFADRPIDWQDVRMILARQGVGNLDWPYVLRYLTPLAEVKEQPEILTRLQVLREKAG